MAHKNTLHQIVVRMACNANVMHKHTYVNTCALMTYAIYVLKINKKALNRTTMFNRVNGRK